MLYNVDPGVHGRDILPDDVKLISHYLGNAGYACGYAGKWHIDRLGPHGHGFQGTAFPGFGLRNQFVEECDEYLRLHGHPGMASTKVWDYHTPDGYVDASLPVPFGYDGIIDVAADLTPAGFVASTTIDLLKDMKDSPFFVTASFWGPHHPALPTEEFAELYPPTDIPEWSSFREDLSARPRIQARYVRDLHQSMTDQPWSVWAPMVSRDHAFMTMIDAQIGRILESLKTFGLEENTMVIFPSDHGDTLGCHGGQFDKGPYVYEETYAVPLLVRAPSMVSRQEESLGVVKSVVSNMDIFPTILDFGEIPVPDELHSRSFASALEDPDQQVRECVVSEFSGFDLRGMYMQRAIWNGRYKYVFCPGDFDELYDLQDDPHELHNRIDDREYQANRQVLARMLYREMKRTKDPFAKHADSFLGI